MNTQMYTCLQFHSCPSKLYLSWPPGTELLSSFNFSIEMKLHFQIPGLKETEYWAKVKWQLNCKSIFTFCFYFTYDILHVPMPFSHIIPPSPSPTESKRLFYTSVSLLLSRIHGYHYHLSKFHIYALVLNEVLYVMSAPGCFWFTINCNRYDSQRGEVTSWSSSRPGWDLNLRLLTGSLCLFCHIRLQAN